MDASGASEAISAALSTVLAAVATAVAAVAGGVLNAWSARRKQRDKDLAAAKLKIREIEDELNLPPTDMESLDDVFHAIRRINRSIREMEL